MDRRRAAMRRRPPEAVVGQFRTVEVGTLYQPFARAFDPRRQPQGTLRCVVGGGEQRVELGIAEIGEGPRQQNQYWCIVFLSIGI